MLGAFSNEYLVGFVTLRDGEGEHGEAIAVLLPFTDVLGAIATARSVGSAPR